MKSLNGKSAIVTGAAQSLGEAIARKLLSYGCRVLLADMDAKRLEALEAELPKTSATHVVDVSDYGQMEQLFAAASKRFGAIDILVNNAGIEGGSAPLADMPIESFDRAIAINLRSVFISLQLAFRHLTRPGGAIVNMSSVAGLRGQPHMAGYVSSKFGVTGLSRTAAIEGGPLGIRVNSVHPGMFQTRLMDIMEERVARSGVADPAAALQSVIPLGRYGDPGELADLVAFLVSDESSYISGAQFVIDGGNTAS